VTAAAVLGLFLSALAVSLPTFAWVALGLALNRFGLLPEALNNRLSLLAFNFGFPLMLFAGAARVDYTDIGRAHYLLAGAAGAVLSLLLAWQYARWRGVPRRRQGLFAQAAYRSNLAIMGLALAVSAYGEGATALAALPVAVLTLLYNVLAVWVLGATLDTGAGFRAMAMGILRNPLVLGIAAGVLLSLSPLPAPAWLDPVNRHLSAFFLPMMLVCIGGSLTLRHVFRAEPLAWEACAWRLVLAPAVGTALAIALGVRGEALGVLFLLLATPVAASSHVMVVAARGDGQLAAAMVVLSTLLSVFTITLGLFLLSLLGLVGTLR